jgi:hypothetical protein
VAKYIRADTDSISAWLVAYGLPGLLFVVGFAMTGYLDFWFGVSAMVIAAAILIGDAWIRHKWTKKQRICVTSATCFALATILWFVFVPAPLQVVIDIPPGNYPKDEHIFGLQWAENYFPLNVTVSNDTDIAYENFDSYFRTDSIWIARAGVNGGINQCMATPENAAIGITQATISTENKSVSIPLFQSDNQYPASIYRVRCDKIAPHSHVDIILALNGVKATWAIGSFRYDAANRRRGPFYIPKCLINSCPNMPSKFVGG